MSKIYSKNILTRNVNIPFKKASKNIEKLLKREIQRDIEGKCIKCGYIKRDSIVIVSYSSGMITSDSLQYEVVFESLVCRPAEGMVISCKVENITKAGIRATLDDKESPLIIFIARDHHYNNKTFSKTKEGDKIKVLVVGQRYELNDTYISVIAELKKTKKTKKQLKVKKDT